MDGKPNLSLDLKGITNPHCYVMHKYIKQTTNRPTNCCHHLSTAAKGDP